jgi:hypothetical protein
MNTKQQGDIGVAKAIYAYTALGYAVSIPNTDNTKYDLIIDNGELLRVQVKTTRYKTDSGIYKALLKTNGGNQSWNGTVSKLDSSNFDILFVLTEDGNMYEFPSEYVNGMSNINLGQKAEKYRLQLNTW